MNEYTFGTFAVSMAGHDKGQIFIIIKEDREYVYLVDGRLRTLEHPKKKKKIHICLMKYSNDDIMEKKDSQECLTNEACKRAVKHCRNQC